ncbi:hypothetical protein BOTBODRAFT_620932 [Botryobasidium botryosum FD-172 SS1]|uniref:Uncharacterized protein n=1 Tax=Botryobasidium botryosum (strain FD-172 SS1) TaxID=930990 RepID=A0A067LU76_BOTB1|nr:hypothetical protein BOTBODRAFT_620932 [Botryobasidium botryosum FD-172 SS1]
MKPGSGGGDGGPSWGTPDEIVTTGSCLPLSSPWRCASWGTPDEIVTTASCLPFSSPWRCGEFMERMEAHTNKANQNTARRRAQLQLSAALTTQRVIAERSLKSSRGNARSHSGGARSRFNRHRNIDRSARRGGDEGGDEGGEGGEGEEGGEGVQGVQGGEGGEGGEGSEGSDGGEGGEGKGGKGSASEEGGARCEGCEGGEGCDGKVSREGAGGNVGRGGRGGREGGERDEGEAGCVDREGGEGRTSIGKGDEAGARPSTIRVGVQPRAWPSGRAGATHAYKFFARNEGGAGRVCGMHGSRLNLLAHPLQPRKGREHVENCLWISGKIPHRRAGIQSQLPAGAPVEGMVAEEYALPLEMLYEVARILASASNDTPITHRPGNRPALLFSPPDGAFVCAALAACILPAVRRVARASKPTPLQMRSTPVLAITPLDFIS